MKLIHDLRQATRRTEKEFILSLATENEKKVLFYAYNPYLRFGIKNIPAGQDLGIADISLFNILDDLASGILTGNESRAVVESHASTHGDLIYLICRKNLNCGITATTINKVFPNLIPVFKVQLAKEVPMKDLSYPMIAEIKYDGVRVIARVEDNECKLYTRNGMLINCPQLSTMINWGSSGNYILDGEITVASGKMEGRTSISGRINSAIKGGELSINDLTYNVFDYLTIKEFDTQTCVSDYSQRKTSLLVTLTETIAKYNTTAIIIADSKIVNSVEQADDFYNDCISKGYEGIILKNICGYYNFKRSKDWVKVKAVKTADLVCYGYSYGKAGTKYENVIGALKCSGKVEGVGIVVSVGSGLTDDERNCDFVDMYINKTITVKYNDVIPAHAGEGYTLFLPRFVSVRFDK